MLAALFDLDPAERLILGLAAAAELEPAVTEAVRKATGGDRADVALAVALLPEAGWDAFCPEGPLRRWRLIELDGSGLMLRRAIAIDERVLHFLLGLNYLDARLEGLVGARRADADARRAARPTLAAEARGRARAATGRRRCCSSPAGTGWPSARSWPRPPPKPGAGCSASTPATCRRAGRTARRWRPSSTASSRCRTRCS